MVVQLSKLAFKCPYLPSSLLLKIHDATLKPAILYGAEIWGLETIRCPGGWPFNHLLEKIAQVASECLERRDKSLLFQSWY